MATFKDLQDRIALDYLNRYDLMPSVKRAIVNAIKCYEAQRYWFNQTASTTTTTANTSYFGVPGDFLALDRIEIAEAGARLPLIAQPFDVIREMNIVSSTGSPTHFAYRGDRFELAVIPDSAYTVTTYYLHTLPTLSADTDSNAWTNEAQNLIVHAATLDMMRATLVTPDTKRIAYHQQMLQMAQTELYCRNDLRLAGKLRATHF